MKIRSSLDNHLHTINRGIYKKPIPKTSPANENRGANVLEMLANYNKSRVTFTSKKENNFRRKVVQEVDKLPIDNLHCLENNSLRGESLSSRKNRKFLVPIKTYGIKNVIDLRDKFTSGVYEDLCHDSGLSYFNIPIDSSSVDDESIIKNLPKLFDLIDGGNVYIACAQGLHRTDIAMALNYVYNKNAKEEPPILYGHFRSYGFKCDDIARRLNSIQKKITPQDALKLGWDDFEDFKKETKMRKKKLFEYNSSLVPREMI